jgi:5-formyltetrahydrofolate cyclo-ligase
VPDDGPTGPERDEKRALRERMRATRRGLPPAARAEASAAITRHVRASAEWRRAGCVGLYASFRDEVDTAALLDAAREEGRRVALPVVTGRDLVFRDVTDPARRLSASRLGVPEPGEDAPVVPLDAIHLFVVPGLAFDRQGGRLGYGAGFYDRALAGLPAPRVLIAFAAQEVARVPAEPHDRPMDAIVTEDGYLAIPGGRWR